MSTRDNHVVVDLSRCESNESPWGNLASHGGSVRVGLLTLVSVMVNLRDYLKSVWCATGHKNQNHGRLCSADRVRSDSKAEREKINYDEVQKASSVWVLSNSSRRPTMEL